MRRVVLLAVTVAASTFGQDANSIVQKLNAQFAMTQTTADKSDIVKAGSVVVLHKDKLVMYSVANPIPPQSTYKKGKISRNVLGGKSFLTDLGNTMHTGEDASSIQQRVFVTGEKFWVMSITAVKDGVVFRFCSDPYDDVRYWGELKVPFPKGSVPPVNEFLNTVAEAVTVQPDENAAAPEPQPAAPAQREAARPAPAEKPLAPIPPPPPPPADEPPTKTISLGQTKEEVLATFGQPQRIFNLGAKQIFYYSDMKVTLLNGKVSDVAEVTK